MFRDLHRGLRGMLLFLCAVAGACSSLYRLQKMLRPSLAKKPFLFFSSQLFFILCASLHSCRRCLQRRNKRNASSSHRRRTRRGHRSFPRPHRCRLNRRRSHQERRHHRSHVHIRETIVFGKMKHFSRRKSCVLLPS